MALALILVPTLGALAAFAIRDNHNRPWLLVAVAVAHLALTVLLLCGATPPPDTSWLWLDPPGRLVLGLVSVLFLATAVYAVGYLRYRHERANAIFIACLNALLAALTVAILARHLGLMWVAVEASALAAAPLIYFNKNKRSIEATWKYLLVGSVGVAIALLGTFFIAYSAVHAGAEPSLRFDDLAQAAPTLSKPWLRAGFVLALVGYGTKMGLAPMHTWKPDAYGEAPGLAGALLAGGVTSAAFLAILRILRVCNAAGEGAYASSLLLGLGLFSMAVAAALLVGQRDVKRMLAYSSVEHMGILAIGVSLGGVGIFGAMLHLLANGLTKGVLFLSAANLHRGYQSRFTTDVSGALRGMPASATLFLLGFFAITGAPPFGPFVSELTIARAAFLGDQPVAGALFLLFLMIVFIGMGQTVLKLCFGDGPGPTTTWRDRAATTGPIFVLLALVLMLGTLVPDVLTALLTENVAWLEVAP
ncbi:MAG: hydrogenase [Deltaproteobacteria bacterium HGW-Deltaproteobacteria-14]|jgi:hydrogenase-4 component F|nr:MAG: hydrogenase [Deltaproteobacteria bacterium HGW-Deltaproteobacteria-14]